MSLQKENLYRLEEYITRSIGLRIAIGNRAGDVTRSISTPFGRCPIDPVVRTAAHGLGLSSFTARTRRAAPGATPGAAHGGGPSAGPSARGEVARLMAPEVPA